MGKNLMIRAACTVISMNYIAYARTLCDSFLAFHPDCKFYVLLVDRIPSNFNHNLEKFKLIEVEDLDIVNFKSIAFKYDILELNTNVKATFLKFLLSRGIEELVYLDPDIFIYRSLDSVFDALDFDSIVISPHVLSPIPDNGQSELIFLSCGVYNLGFIAVKASVEAGTFLSWWENRCLNLAFDEQRTGMFVDQKWINLAPCIFDSIKIHKNIGCNMAYWNLHERSLSQEEGVWFVNKSIPLEFFHFSGISVNGGDQISKYSDKLNLNTRPDLKKIFQDYRSSLIEHGFMSSDKTVYAFGRLDNGQNINRLVRSMYAANLDKFIGQDPFSTSSEFYKWAQTKQFFSASDSYKKYTSRSYKKEDIRIKLLHSVFRFTLLLMGADRYTVAMKYLSHISILKNQNDVLMP